MKWLLNSQAVLILLDRGRLVDFAYCIWPSLCITSQVTSPQDVKSKIRLDSRIQTKFGMEVYTLGLFLALAHQMWP